MFERTINAGELWCCRSSYRYYPYRWIAVPILPSQDYVWYVLIVNVTNDVQIVRFMTMTCGWIEQCYKKII